MRKQISFGIAVLSLLVVTASISAQETANASVNAPALLTRDKPEIMLGPGDTLRIWVLGLKEIPDRPFRIDDRGEVDLPVIGRVTAAGHTVEGFRLSLTKALEKEMWKPSVSVELVEFGSRPVSVLGAVNTPGVHQTKAGMRLADMLSLAGGLRTDAGHSITISRPLEAGALPLPSTRTDATGKFYIAEVNVHDFMSARDPATNILVMPRDVITVPTSEMVYVIGTVRKPGAFVLRERSAMSVLQALTMAEGFAPAASPEATKILRTVPGSSERKEISIDLNRVLKGRQEDLMLKPNDILFIPSSTAKKVGARTIDALIYTATGIAIWRR